MYFLATLLTLKAIETDQFPSFLAEKDGDIPSRQTLRSQAAFQGVSLMTAALLSSDARRTLMRLTCCSQARDAPGMVLEALTSRPTLEFGQRCYEVESVDSIDPVWTGTSTWLDLLNEQYRMRMRFTFATPLVTINQECASNNNALPFPDPQTLFLSLLLHWRALGGPPLPYREEQMVQAARCVVTEYNLETAERTLEEHSHLGYLGWIEYTCRTREMTAVTSLNALARLAFFTGSGYLNEQGMGATAVTVAN